MKLRFSAVLAIVLVGVIMRWLPHPANFTPVGAVALFGGSYFINKRFAFAIPLAVMLVSDLLLGMHALMPLVYFCIILTALLGTLLSEKKSVATVAGASLLASALFFVVTNFGSWLVMPEYTKDLSGLVTCFVAAIPFWSHSFVGDLFYTLLFFGTAELLVKKCPKMCVSSTR